MQKLLRWPCHGDPKFTFSDVECAVQRVMRERNYLGGFELGAEEELRVAEMKDLERLEAKYRKQKQTEEVSTTREPAPPALRDSSPSPQNVPVQIGLF